MSITCKFELSRISNIYYSGEEIAGSITICILKQRQIEAITLEFYGQSTLQWWELDKTKEQITHNDFSTKEVPNKTFYQRQQKHVCEQLQLAPTTNLRELQAHVEYTFHFSFTLPKQVPATLYCSYGQTEYGLRLQMQHAKKVNKEFHQRIVVKNKLDLSKEIKYKEPKTVYRCNKFGEIKLHIPCNGFTPGQKIPYHIICQKAHADYKLLIQLNCITTCHTHTNIDKLKQIKQIVCQMKHLSAECKSHIIIPLNSKISSLNDPELLLITYYTLEAILITGNKKILLAADIPITIGTTPCYRFNESSGVAQSYMCYDNLGSSSLELSQVHDTSSTIYNISYAAANELFESLWMLPIKRKTHLRKSLRYFYKKLVKLI